MEDSKLTKRITVLAGRILELAVSNRDLELGLARHGVVNRSLDIEAKKAEALLEESLNLQKHLQDVARKILNVREERRRTMSLRLQDEIVQTLEGIHLRLLVLNKEVSASSHDFQKEIATTQELVRQSTEVIKSFSRGANPGRHGGEVLPDAAGGGGAG